MSEQNVMVVRDMWEAFLRNDFEAALSAFDPDVEWDGTNLPDGKISRGLEAIVEHLTKGPRCGRAGKSSSSRSSTPAASR